MTKFELWSKYVARSKKPILLGPWREEIGSEVLYWLPWLEQWIHTYQIDRSRLIAISRGGAGSWYRAARTIELYDYVPAKDLRLEILRHAQGSGTVKQIAVTSWERTFYALVKERLGLRRYHVLHPSAMYQQIRQWQSEREGLGPAMDRFRFTPIPTPHLPLNVALPEKFICVRFYERHTWRLSEEIRDYCTALVENLAKHIPIVVIGSSAHHDDHLDLGFSGPNITSLIDAFPLRDNLALQSAVIAKSSAFVGTYGGTMQLAVRLQKPSAGFYQHFKGTAFAHQTLTRWLALQQQTPIFIGTPGEADLVRSIVSVPLELPPSGVGSSSGVTA